MEKHLKNRPRVSIGMPVYNGGHFIREALESLLLQNFTDFELIISDNASIDATETICREYAAKDTRIRYSKQKENRGPAHNFLFVLEEAIGEYFMWAAADDQWDKAFISTCVKMLDITTEANMAMTGYECVSRTFPLVRLRFDHPLACIEYTNPVDRILAYTAQNFVTHKDNLVYSMWRKNFLIALVTEGIKINLGVPAIGGAMCEFALAKSKGVYNKNVLFIKRYRYLPPGHVLNPLLGLLSNIKRLFVDTSSERSNSNPAEAHYQTLKVLLQACTYDEAFIDKVIELNRRYA